MIKQKSKSNILPHQKRQSKPSIFIIKSKDKNQGNLKDKNKIPSEAKKPKQTQKQSKSSKNILLRSKIPLEKSSHQQPKNYQQLDHQLFNCVQRRNSASIVSQRAPSRISNKRSSVASCKSTKFFNEEEHKENDSNKNNLNEVENHQNECEVNDIKHSNKDTNSKTKLALNINKQTIGQIQTERNTHIKAEKKNKVHMFEKKMSKYLNEKDIFSQQFLNEKNPSKNKSKKNLNPKSKDKIEEKIQKGKKNSEKDNLLEIYQFYKKTFDINIKNCMKKGSNSSKDDKSKQINWKTTIKPSNSSTMIFKREINEKLSNHIELFERKNESKCSVQSKSRSKSKETLSKSKRNESRSIYDKENRLLSHIQMSSLLESRSKSRSSMINSQISTKDPLLSYQVDRSCANSTREEANLKRSKKSFKQLIIFKENQTKKENDSNRIENEKDLISSKRNCEQSKLSNLKDSSRFIAKDKQSEVIDLKQMEIGESNVDVLNWWSNEKRQLSTSVLKNQVKNDNKMVREDLINQTINPITDHESVAIIEKAPKQNSVSQQKPYLVESNIIIQEQFTKIIKKKSDQISSLEDLSSISSIHDLRDQNSHIKMPVQAMFEAQDAAFEL